MPCNRSVPILGDLDDFFGFNVARVVKIRDGWIGFSHNVFFIVGMVMLFIKFWYWDRAYMKEGTVAGISRIQPLAPYPAWSSEALQIRLPFCSSSTTDQAPALAASATSPSKFKGTYYEGGVTLTPPSPAYPLGSYTLAGQTTVNPVYKCLALDDRWLVTNPLDPTGFFVPTRIVAYQESAPSCSVTGTHTNATDATRAVFNTTSGTCSYSPSTPKQSYYIPDVEAYTLKLDHELSVFSLNFNLNKDQMFQGSLVGANGKTVDPCAFYARRNPSAPCPSTTTPNTNATNYISLGQTGVPDIVAIGTLLEAAGVASLDAPGYPTTESMRYGGLTLVVQVTYDNYWAEGEDAFKKVKYTLHVQAIPGKVKGIFGESPSGDMPTTSRYIFEKSGLRILMVFTGRIGNPDFVTTFVNLIVILGAGSIASVLTGLVISYGLTFSKVYSRYIVAVTHDLSHLTTKEDIKSVVEQFGEDKYILAPPPKPILEAIKGLKRAAKGTGGGGAPAQEVLANTATLQVRGVATTEGGGEPKEGQV